MVRYAASHFIGVFKKRYGACPENYKDLRKADILKFEVRFIMQTEKIHIERNSVQETLIVPLYGRKMCAEKFPDLYTDHSAKTFCESLDYDFSALEDRKDTFFYEFGALEAAMRQLDIMWEVKDYLNYHPNAVVVNLGCGLDQTGRACDNGACQIVNIDFPDIISAREQLMPAGDREKNIAVDLRNYKWMNEIDGTNGVIFFAAGVFHYCKAEEVRHLVLTLSERYAGGRLVFDTVGKLGLKLMMSKILKNMGITDIDGFFYVNDPAKELNWSENMKVLSRGYMLGYYDMKTKGVRLPHRLLAQIGDSWLKMAVHRIEF